MTIHALAEVAISDVDRFVEVFGGEGLAKRSEHGCSGTMVFTPADETGRVVVLLEFPNAESLAAFQTDPTAPPIMKKGGAQGPPVFRVLKHVASFEH